jgi:hypothetical protein
MEKSFCDLEKLYHRLPESRKSYNSEEILLLLDVERRAAQHKLIS